MKRTACEGLDLIEIAHRRRLAPFLYVHLRMEGAPELERLKRAVAASCRYVPEVLAGVDYGRCCFAERGLSAEDVLIRWEQEDCSLLRWDLQKGPQLRLLLRREPQGSRLLACVSHILTDGSGALQYLGLLCALYNGDALPDGLRNVRSVREILRENPVPPLSRQSWERNRPGAARPPSAGEAFFWCRCTLSPQELAAVRQAARAQGATLNDACLTAYARVLSRQRGGRTVTLSCPADLRRLARNRQALTVGNMTGLYRGITASAAPDDCFAAALRQIRRQTARQKAGRACCSGIPELERAAERVPGAVLCALLRRLDGPPETSYTNFGAVGEAGLRLSGCRVTDCFLTGTFRRPPSFQLSVSTFREVCTLSCALAGSAQDARNSQRLLEQIKRELLTQD